MGKEDYLPLFLTLKEPLAFYVIDNEIIGCEDFRGKKHPNIVFSSYTIHPGHSSSGTGFYFLEKLYQHEITRKAFPKELSHHFEPTKDKELYAFNYSFMRNYDHSGRDYKLYLNISIDEQDDAKPVIIHKFSYENILLDYEVRLSAKEAFFLFANICTNALCHGTLSVDKRSFDKLLYREIIRPSENFSKESGKFVVDYLNYLRISFLEGNIKPEFISKLSGVRLLVYLAKLDPVNSYLGTVIKDLDDYTKLSKSKKIIYYSLLKLMEEKAPSKSIKEFFRKKSDILNKLMTELLYAFPKRKLEEEMPELSKKEFKETFMPIFWFQEQPIEIYVINNKLLGAKTGYGGFDNGSPHRAFKLVMELYNNPFSKKAIPESLWMFLDEVESPEIGNVSSLYEYLLGWHDPHANTVYLNLDIKIRENKKQSVLLQNFTFRDMVLNVEFSLSCFEAFILFTNICLSKRIEHLGMVFGSNKIDWNFEKIAREKGLEKWDDYYEVYVDEIVRNHPKKMEDELRKRYSEDNKAGNCISHFSLNYLFYLREQLINKTITPMEILRLSGAAVLTYLAPDFQPIENFILQIIEEMKKPEKLSLNKKIMYTTLLEMCNDKLGRFGEKDSIVKKVKEFYKNHYNVIHAFRNQIDRKYPRTERQLLEWTMSASKDIPKQTQVTIQPSVKEKTNLPLFLVSSNFQLYTIDNDLFLYQESTNRGNSVRSFVLLRQLFNSEFAKNAFPKSIHYTFNDIEKLFAEDFSKCLFGSDEINLRNCLNLEVIEQTETKSIILKNFLFNKKPLEYSIELRPEEAFLLFGNICYNYSYHYIVGEMKRNKLQKFDKEFLKNRFQESLESGIKRWGMKHWMPAASLFMVEYIDYLIKSLENGSLKPEKLLRLSGATVLVSLIKYKSVQEYIQSVIKKMKNVNELTRNELIMYFSLIENLSFEGILGKEVMDYYKENREVILKIKDYFKKTITRKILEEQKPVVEELVEREQQIEKESQKETTKHLSIEAAIEEARKKTCKIVLVKADTYTSATNDISKVLAKEDERMNYPSLFMIETLYRLVSAREMALQQAMTGKVNFEPPLTNKEVLDSIKEILRMRETGEVTHPETGEKLKVAQPKISPEYKDLLVIGFFFSQLVRLGRLDNYHIKLFLDAIIELSKEKTIIMPHPECDLLESEALMYTKFGMTITPIPNDIMKEFLEIAVIASEEPK